ncbi:hypothetical protein LTR08_006184 [Meristemomyces frigidus]|nr:hypothetical protein LTR08_006184 [Meristemomyces frigidus]
MDALLHAHATLESSANLTRTLADVQHLIDTLQTARAAVAENPDVTAQHMARLKQPVAHAFERIDGGLKEVNKGLNQYQKALKDKFKVAAAAGGSGAGGGGGAAAAAGAGSGGGGAGLGGEAEGGGAVLDKERGLVERAVGMHLLREALFDVAGTYVAEVAAGQEQQQQQQRASSLPAGASADDDDDDTTHHQDEADDVHRSSDYHWLRDFAASPANTDEEMEDGEIDEDSAATIHGLGRGQLQQRFAEMYRILAALRSQHDLGPAIAWARAHSGELEARGSELEFELSRLRFVELYTQGDENHNNGNNGNDTAEANPEDDNAAFAPALRALAYARATFPAFSARYTRPTASLLGSLAFAPNLPSSPYPTLFPPPTTTAPAPTPPSYHALATTFSAQYLATLTLPPSPPLYTATTAGTIALPTLQKLTRILTAARGQWSSVHELPVETPLPGGYTFHSVFVCPVSKEQATDANPPMMLPCGHVLCKESLEGVGRGKVRVKCPYCPWEGGGREGRRVFI